MSRIKKRNFLIVARVGDRSLHRQWLEPSYYKNFDLYISYFGDQPRRYVDDSDFYIHSKGPKWPKLKNIVTSMGDTIFEYDAVWFPDDDLLCDAYTINKMFNLFIDNQFELAQPSLTSDSYYSHFVTLENKDYLWRYSHFVEVMAPIFSKKALKACWETFDINLSGWGLDILWPKLLGYPQNKIAVIDCTPVKHTRPVGGGTLYSVAQTPFEELHQLEIDYGVSSETYGLPHYGGVTKQEKKGAS